jgi:hypothetical protein
MRKPRTLGTTVTPAIHVEIRKLSDESLRHHEINYPTPKGSLPCLECGFEDAVVVLSHLGDRGCFCPECQHVWVDRSVH